MIELDFRREKNPMDHIFMKILNIELPIFFYIFFIHTTHMTHTHGVPSTQFKKSILEFNPTVTSHLLRQMALSKA